MIRSRWAKVAGLLALLFLLAATVRTDAGLRLATSPRAKATTSLTGPVVLSPAAMAGINRTGTSFFVNPTFLTVRLRSNGEERTVLEFHLSGISGTVPQSFLGFWLQNGQPGGAAALAVLSTYAGDGQVTAADFNAGTPRLSFASDLSLEIVNLDVTALLQEAVNSGLHYLGFVFSTSTTDRLQIHLYQEPRLTVGGLTTFAPVLQGTFPSSILAGTPGLTLRLLGNNFAPGAVAQWNGADRPTTGVVDNLYVELSASDLVTPSVATLTVMNPGPAGGVSNSIAFDVRSPVTYFVDDDAPQDPGPNDPSTSDPLEDGSEFHPFDSIQEALNLSLPGDIAQLLPGLYVEDLATNQFGASIHGSGAAVTRVRSVSGQTLFAETEFLPLYSLFLSLKGLTLEGGTVRLLGHLEARIEDVVLEGVDLQLLQRPLTPTSLDVNRLTMNGGSLTMTGASGGLQEQLSVTVRNLLAPDTELEFALGTPGSSSTFTLTDSTVGGLLYHDPSNPDGGQVRLTVSRVHFGAGGLRIAVHYDHFYVGLIEDSLFDGGDLQVEHRYDYDGGDFFVTTVRHCRFVGAGIEYSMDPGHVTLVAEANHFLGGGIRTHWNRVTDHVPHTIITRAINNIFENAPEAIAADYGASYPLDCDYESPGDHQLEAFNNTIVGSDSGVRVQIVDPLRCGDTITPILRNNIIAFGGVGVSVSGFDPEGVTMSTNDVYGNSGPNYVGLADRTGWYGNISLDPLFVDRAAGDLHLAFGSPCIDAGQTLLGIVTTDFDGRPRPLRGRYEGNALTDIGAFEFELAPSGPGGVTGGTGGGGSKSLNLAEQEEDGLE